MLVVAWESVWCDNLHVIHMCAHPVSFLGTGCLIFIPSGLGRPGKL